MILCPPFANRIRRLVPMLSSPHDGEVIATRNAIGRELAAGGFDWHGLAASIADSDFRPKYSPPCSAEPPSFGDLARACRDLDSGRLTERERGFVADMCARGYARQPSPKQYAWMRAIYASLRPRAAA